MLRTHSDLAYRQEQRFHLELGLLKLVHAQRLLPLEQLLSAEAAGTSGVPVRAPSEAGATSSRSAAPGAPTSKASASRTAAVSPFKGASPFEADRRRKSEPKAETFGFDSRSASQVNGFIAETPTATVGVAVAEDPLPDAVADVTSSALRDAVLAALEDAGQQMLAHNLESGQWTVRAHEVTVTVAMSQVMVDVALGDGPKRIVNETLERIAGKPMKFKMVSGVTQFGSKAEPGTARPANGAGARSRAMSDPIVQRMQEKFGAEIRSVIDHKERG